MAALSANNFGYAATKTLTLEKCITKILESVFDKLLLSLNPLVKHINKTNKYFRY